MNRDYSTDQFQAFSAGGPFQMAFPPPLPNIRGKIFGGHVRWRTPTHGCGLYLEPAQ